MHQESSARVPILMVKETTAPSFLCVRLFLNPITFGITLLLNGRVELNDSSPTNDASRVPRFQVIIFGWDVGWRGKYLLALQCLF